MIDPPSAKRGNAFCTVKSSPLTLMLKTLSKCSSVIDPSGVNAATPALANRTSRRPCCCFTVANSRSRSARCETSPCTPVTCLPTCLTASSSSAWRRPVMKTWAPSATKRRAVARPMPLLPPVMTATLPSSFFDIGLLRCPCGPFGEREGKGAAWPGGPGPAGSRGLYQAEQALRGDLPRLLAQLVNDLTGRLDLADQAHALARQQSHRLDVAARLAVRRHAHEAQHRHRLAADYRLTDRRLVGARFLAAGPPAEPLLHERRPQRPVRGVRPAVAEQDGPDRAPLVRLQQPPLVVGMGTRLGAGQEPGPQHRPLRAQRQDGNDAAAIGDAAGRDNRQRGDGVHDARDQS